MALREYQVKARNAAREVLARGGRPLVISPTGSGKTHLCAAIADDYSLLWVAHRRELIEQAAEHLAAVGRPAAILCGGFKPGGGDGRTFVASIQTLARREMPDVDLVWTDEAHHFPSAGYQKLLGAKRLGGCTATGFRLDGRPLAPPFTDIVVAAHVDELAREGYLILPRMFASESPDLHGIRSRGGDYAIDAIRTVMNTPQLVGDAVAHWFRFAHGMKTLAFATTIEHSRAVVQAFLSAGVRAEHVDGKTPKARRDEIFQHLRDGRLDLVSNVGIATEGFDLPALECLVVLRPTASLGLHLQMLGRALRPSHGKRQPIVLDHAGNCLRHGSVDQRLEYSLTGRVRLAAGASANLGLKRCLGCYALVHSQVSTCPHCGHVFETSRKVKIVDGELVEIVTANRRRIARWTELLDFSHERREIPTAPIRRYRSEFGMWPDPSACPAGEFTETATATHGLKVYVWRRLVDWASKSDAWMRWGTSNRGINGWCAGRYHDLFRQWPNREVMRATGAAPIEIQESLL